MKGLPTVPSRSGRAVYFLGTAVLIAMVNDGWSGRPFPLLHQLLLLPFACLFTFCLYRLLEVGAAAPQPNMQVAPDWRSLSLLGLFEAVSFVGFGYEALHFGKLGYRPDGPEMGVVACVVLACVLGWLRFRTSSWILGGSLAAYAAGVALAVMCFPLNYLRSDMLPVIIWADERLSAHLNPYGTMYVGNRVYDFPYLPGMLLAYFPTVALHVDPRWFNLLCLILLSILLYRAAEPRMRSGAAALISVFLLSPFLQYRHDLYLAPHWLALAGAIALLRWKRENWAAVVFGVSMAIYQLSWVLWPFLLLYALRRRGWAGALRAGVLSLAAMLILVGPFLTSAMQRIENNTVGQWSRMPHALADPMNLSYWVTYMVRPDQLKWVQLGVLAGLFAFCVVAGRCRTLEDTLRWMSVGLAVFIALNVLVDGYFYLTLLLVLLTYTLVVTGIWVPQDNVYVDLGSTEPSAV